MSSGAPAYDDSFDGGTPIPAAGTPQHAPSPDSWDVPQSPAVEPAVVAPARHPTNSPNYDITDNSLHTLFLELDFHQTDIACGNAFISLSEVFDMTYMMLKLGFAMHLQDAVGCPCQLVHSHPHG